MDGTVEGGSLRLEWDTGMGTAERMGGPEGKGESRRRVSSVVEAGRVPGSSGDGVGKPINFTMANSETVATPFLQFTEVIKV